MRMRSSGVRAVRASDTSAFTGSRSRARFGRARVQRFGEPLGAERLQQVVHGVHLKRPDGVLS